MTTSHAAELLFRADDAVSDRLLDALAAVDGFDPLTVEPVLYDVVDPEAIDRLFAPTAAGGRAGTVTFEYIGARITIAIADGRVSGIDIAAVEPDADAASDDPTT